MLDFGMGTIRALFQELGRMPVDNDKLNNLVRDGVMDAATDFNILAEMLSGPVDLEVSRLETKSNISSSLHRRSTGQLSGQSEDGSGESGGRVLLKQSWKKEFNNEALSLLLSTLVPFDTSVGIEESCLFSSLIAFQNAFISMDCKFLKYFDLFRRRRATTRLRAARYL